MKLRQSSYKNDDDVYEEWKSNNSFIFFVGKLDFETWWGSSIFNGWKDHDLVTFNIQYC